MSPADRLLTRTGVGVVVLAIVAITLWPIFSQHEGSILPVTTKAEVRVLEGEPATTFYVSFKKLRQCDFIGIAWYRGAERLTLLLEPNRELAPATRPIGPQEIGPWQLLGVEDIKSTHAHVFHRCHPFYTTVTPFYGEQSE